MGTGSIFALLSLRKWCLSPFSGTGNYPEIPDSWAKMLSYRLSCQVTLDNCLRT